jgi:hypothetical protein
MATVISPKRRLNPTVLLLVALWIFWGFGYETLWKRLLTDVQGTVTSARSLPYPLAPARHATEYTFTGPDGQQQSYIAGPTDASLPRNMPVGTHIGKRRWRVSYERDGERVNDFSLLFYGLMLSVAAVCLYWGVRSRYANEMQSNGT